MMSLETKNFLVAKLSTLYSLWVSELPMKTQELALASNLDMSCPKVQE